MDSANPEGLWAHADFRRLWAAQAVSAYGSRIMTVGVTAKDESLWLPEHPVIPVGFTTPFPGLKFGAGVSNFGTKMRMAGDDLLTLKAVSSNLGSNQAVNADFSTDPFDLPLTLRIGLAYQPLNTDDQELTVAVDALHPNDNSESLNVGAEYTTLGRILSIRGGYNGLGMKDGEEQFTVGGGLSYEVAPGIFARVDYAFEKFGRLNNVHKFGVGILF